VTPRTPSNRLQKGGLVFATLVFAATYLLPQCRRVFTPRGDPGWDEISYDFMVLRVVENQPFSLDG